MASFTEKIKIVVETTTGQASTDLKKFSAGVKEADGAAGKFKAGLGGAADFLRNNMGLSLATAGTAIAAFGVKAVNAAQDVALSAGKLADATGLTVEQASRWNEVAGDIGISTETLTTAFGKLGKEIGKNPQHFADLGVQIVRAKDGTVDMNATILGAIDVLNRTPDATKRAALGAELFGKGWQNIAELIAKGSGQIRDSLDSVADSKVIDPAELDRARKFRETMDSLSDTVEGLTITFGELVTEGIGPTLRDLGALVSRVDKLGSIVGGTGGGLIPKLIGNLPGVGSLSGLSTALGDNVDNVDRLKGAVTAVLPPLKLLPGGLFDTETAAEKAARKQKELTEAVEKGRAAGQASLRAYDDLGASFTEAATATTDLADAEEETAAQTKRAAEAAKEHAAALKEEQEAALAMIGGARDLADVNRDLWVATLAAKDATAEAAKAKGKDAEANAKAVEQIIKVADLTVKQYEAQIAANGGIVDATKKLDVWNDAALTQAATLRGPARDSLLTYIGQVNQIPPAKLTEIQALLDQGKLTEAKQLIADASKTRTVTLVAQLNTEAFWADYNSIRQRVRNNPIAVPIVPGGRVGFAQGGVARFAQGGVALVGERGPELVGLPDGANVQPTERIRNWLQQNTATINVSTPVGGPGFEREVVKAIRRFQRSNGDLAMGTRH